MKHIEALCDILGPQYRRGYGLSTWKRSWTDDGAAADSGLYVSRENPVRAYDAFVEALDFKDLGIDIDHRKVGNSEYDPENDAEAALVWLLIRREELQKT